MSESGRALACRERDAIRRLSRLFRIERNGGFDRRPATMAAKLIERRAALIAALMVMDCERRRVGAETSPAFDRALAELVREIPRSRDQVTMRLQQIGKNLRLSRGEGLPSGIRDRTGGQSLGKI